MYKIAIVILSFSMATFAQTASHSSKAKPSKAGNTADSMFVKKAAQGNMAEVAMGKLATQNAQSDDVKKFGQRMVDDHSKAEQDLEGVASKNNWTLPQDVSAQQKAEQQKMEKMNGAAFDRAYMAMMVKDHEADVKDFQKEADKGQDPDVKSFASSTLPTLQEHLNLAKGDKDKAKKEPKNNSYSEPK